MSENKPKTFNFISISEARRLAIQAPMKVAESHYLLQREIESLKEQLKELQKKVPDGGDKSE